jgi:SNF2 family DNA or RNA helicase
MQKIMYKQIQGQGLCMVGAGGAVKLAGLNNVEMQLRKVCNHPYLHFGEEQYERARNETPEHIWRSSGKFELLHRVLPKLKALGHEVLPSEANFFMVGLKREASGGEDEPEDEKVAILRPHLESDQMGAYRIEQTDDGMIFIRGKRLEQFTKMTNFDNIGSRHRFLDVMQNH